MKTAPASGLQIAFFTFAVLLLAVPATQWILDLQPWSPSMKAMLEKAVIFSIGFAILFGVPAVRRQSFGYLARPVPGDARVEVAGTRQAAASRGEGARSCPSHGPVHPGFRARIF